MSKIKTMSISDAARRKCSTYSKTNMANGWVRRLRPPSLPIADRRPPTPTQYHHLHLYPMKNPDYDHG